MRPVLLGCFASLLPLLSCGGPSDGPDQGGGAEGAVDEAGSTEKFRLAEHDLFPESVAYDPVTGDYLLGSMAHPRILRIRPDGTVTDFLAEAPEELAGSIGMKVDAERRSLWVCTGRFTLYAGPDSTAPHTGVLRFDLDTGALLGAWMIEQESPFHIFNDLAVAANGDVFATTTLIGRTYRISPREPELVLLHQLPAGSNNNGITLGPRERYLFLTVDRRIQRLDLETGEMIAVSTPGDEALGTDGLYYVDGALIAVKPRYDEISRLWLDESLSEVLRVDVLAKGEPEFAYPTTGVLVGDTLVFVATSFGDQERRTDPGPQHDDVLIHQVGLN